MTEAEWINCAEPDRMLDWLRRGGAGARKLRLFAVACSRRAWGRLDDWGRAAVEVAEQYADGLAGADVLRAARLACKFAGGGAAWYAAASDPSIAAGNAARSARGAADPRAEGAAQADLLRDIFGPLPFRPLSPVEPAVLAWNDGAVKKLAQTIYDERSFDRLPELATALQEAGCASTDLLAHCQAPGPHTLGCWAVDFLLGKE
jgi:hypothetical protein